MIFIDYNQLYKDVIQFSSQIDRQEITAVAGIPRSGMLPASILATYLNVPLGTIINGHPVFFSGGMRDNGMNQKKALILDDSLHTGNSMKEVLKSTENCKHGVIYASMQPDYLDYKAKIVPHPRMFSWNFMNHAYLTQACVDFDGVLCEDPPPGTDDDGPTYISWIKNATPKHIPRMRIKEIVTCRLEKYRQVSEQWLKKWGVKYEKLTMMNYNSRQERIATGQHIPYKADRYEKSGAMIFIESSKRQAEGIANTTKKPVICVDTMNLYQ